nr:MAG TPA: hypothetical protein [Caudoviricetes sp.]
MGIEKTFIENESCIYKSINNRAEHSKTRRSNGGNGH